LFIQHKKKFFLELVFKFRLLNMETLCFHTKPILIKNLKISYLGQNWSKLFENVMKFNLHLFQLFIKISMNFNNISGDIIKNKQ